ncbi:helix-turn-helix domain-containing protein [Roseovarius sp. SCSIO 43702]|uniref:ArsR/SmtB family transcription factor n=1 Tax=Roseovarius sp. SCSIO 43702 TaxID=2823043 RepID=UPI001C73D73D|nr:helix-turn-helix domain-containing protein [Roseovarius sp. SCSIO 43702]QYX55274.1 helix-turn-helix domain-containing protein [Roseovarius sp. SCSIO 43702]
MTQDPKLHHVAAAMADARRARMLCTLMDGRAFTAKELAADAGITPQTASAHLAHLRDAGLIVARRSGRCIYHRLAGTAVAEMLESVGRLAPLDHLQRARRRRGARRDGAAALHARCCYDHLAGALGVAVHDAMCAAGHLERQGAAYALSGSGQAWALRAGFTLRGEARPCLDWSERREHLAGPLARDLLAQMLERGWLGRERTGRALIVSDAGRVALARVFGMDEEWVVTVGTG